MGDLSFLNRNKTQQTQQGVFNLYGETQRSKSASRANTRSQYSQPKRTTASTQPNFTSAPAGSGSFFTSRKFDQKPRKATLNKKQKEATIGKPVYAIQPIAPKVSTKSAVVPKTTATRQAASSLAKPSRPQSVSMNRIRSYDSNMRLR